jgi:hypothetical protein
MSRISACLKLLTLVAALILPSWGCRWRPDIRGKGFGDNTGEFAQKLRPPADEKQLSGIDERSREIERNLGVR